MSWWQQIYRRYLRIVYGRPVVVVSGLPRSGTSMMMMMLKSGGIPVWTDAVRAADDQNPKGYYELERVKELDKGLDKSWVREGRGRAVKIISSLLEHLPADNNYQVLFMNRDLDEILESQRKMLSQRGEASGPAGDAALKTCYEAHLRRVKSGLAREARFTSLDLTYADVLSDPRGTAQRIRAFLGPDLDLTRMTEAVDATLYRNRQERLRQQDAHI